MPSFAEMEEIKRVTANMDPRTAAAMRDLFLITEVGHNAAATELIAACALHTHTVSPRTTGMLELFDLVNHDGTIRGTVRFAVRQAIRSHHLELRCSPELGMSLSPGKQSFR